MVSSIYAADPRETLRRIGDPNIPNKQACQRKRGTYGADAIPFAVDDIGVPSQPAVNLLRDLAAYCVCLGRVAETLLD